MISKLITLVVFFTIGWVVYTQFFGTEEEQKMGKEVIDNAHETVQGIFSIFQHESEKIKEGTYDESIDKLGSLLDDLRANSKNKEQKEELSELKDEQDRIKKEVAKSKETGEEGIDIEKTKEDLKKLTEKVKKIVDVMEEEES